MLNLERSTIGDLLLVIAMAFFFCISVATTVCCGSQRTDPLGLWRYVALSALVAAIFVLIARPAERLGRWIPVSESPPNEPDEATRVRAKRWITVTNYAIPGAVVLLASVASSSSPNLFPLAIVALGIIAAAAFARTRATNRLRPPRAQQLAILVNASRGEVLLAAVSGIIVFVPVALAAIAIFGVLR